MIIRLPDLAARILPNGDLGAPAPTGRTTTVPQRNRARAREAAAGLRELGLDGGERVAVFLDKRIETIVALLACSRAGGVFVPVNPALRPGK